MRDKIAEEIWENIKLEVILEQSKQAPLRQVRLALADFRKIPKEQLKKYIEQGIIRWIDGKVESREEWDKFMGMWREEISPFLEKKLSQLPSIRKMLDEIEKDINKKYKSKLNEGA
jgi:hypothetical protein